MKRIVFEIPWGTDSRRHKIASILATDPEHDYLKVFDSMAINWLLSQERRYLEDERVEHEYLGNCAPRDHLICARVAESQLTKMRLMFWVVPQQGAIPPLRSGDYERVLRAYQKFLSL